jgi:hypothetical protein
MFAHYVDRHRLVGDGRCSATPLRGAFASRSIYNPNSNIPDFLIIHGWTVMYSRAGLVALVLAFLITFIAAAPVPTGNIAPLAPPHTSLSHRIPHSNSRSSQASLDITQTHADNQVLPSVPIAGNPLATRELVFLERRRFNLFSKIRNAFKVRAFIL